MSKQGWNPVDVVPVLCAFANDFLPPFGLTQLEVEPIQKELLNLGLVPRARAATGQRAGSFCATGACRYNKGGRWAFGMRS